MSGFRPFGRGLARSASPSLLLLAGAAAAVTALGQPGRASAEDAPPAVSPGRQAMPPGPPEAEPEPLPMSESGRRAVRGCAVDEPCGDLLDGLRAFEREAFPRPKSGSPWSGRQRVGTGAAPGQTLARRRAVKSPTQLRPDLRWLAGLELPDLPVHWDHRIIRFLEFYVEDPRGQQLMRAWLRAQGRYRDLILRELRRAKLPEDLLYVAMIESSYDSRERSRVGASGLWQFMPGGGAIYGLEQNRWIDERNDPVRATRAVTAYWADLYQRFGDWDLAMAAYNAGYGAVLKGIAKYNTNDFWQLLEYENALPWESSYYVPKALACAIVGRNRAKLGFGDVEPLPPMTYDEVTVPSSVTLAVIARAAGVSVGEIEELNTHIRRGRTPPGVPDFRVRVPRGRSDEFARRFPQLRGDWDTHDAYVVRHGERFEDIAQVHGLSPRALRELNGLDSERDVEGGMVLVVPRVSQEAKAAGAAAAREALYAAGEPKGQPGDKLLVAVPDPDLKVPGRRRVFYRVVTGDSLYRIAQVFRVDRALLAGWNGLDPEAHLHPRMVLQVWVDPRFDAAEAGVALLEPDRLTVVAAGSEEHIARAEQMIGRERLVYTAEKRETYEQIGKKFGLTARDLARINKKPFDTALAPGETCVVYKVVDRSASDRAAEQARAARPAPKKSKRKGR